MSSRADKRLLISRLLLIFVLLFTGFAASGCDCGEGDSTTAFGPDCSPDADGDGVPDEDEDGGGGSGSGTLLFSDIAEVSIRRFEGISDLDTAVVTDPALRGSLTRMTRPGYLSIHPTNNQLVVADEGTIAVLFFDDPTNVTGDVPPTRILTGNNTELVAPRQVFINSASDEMFVLDRGGNRILVFPAAASIDADVAPIRRIGGPTSGINNPAAMIIRPDSDVLTVINPTEILTFNEFSTINGDVPPSGRLNGDATTFQNLTYGDFDGASLVLVDAGTRSILYFDDFNPEQNNQAPTRVIQGNNTGITDPGQFVLTASGNMYLANGTNVLFFETVRELVGDPFPNRRFSALDPPNQTIRGLLMP